jgi:putative component of membrane protein insertase Oxa1/YidC/SpoIIIJ protein YidD
MVAHDVHPMRSFHRRWLLVVCLLIALAAVDAQRAPDRQVGTSLALAAMNGWQALTSGPKIKASCLYTPSCSVYGELAVRRFGGYRGGWLALKRIMRCAPWAEAPGEDWP